MSKVCEPGERKYYKLQASLEYCSPKTRGTPKEHKIYALVYAGCTLREAAKLAKVSYGCVWKTVHRVKNRLKARQEAQ